MEHWLTRVFNTYAIVILEQRVEEGIRDDMISIPSWGLLTQPTNRQDMACQKKSLSLQHEIWQWHLSNLVPARGVLYPPAFPGETDHRCAHSMFQIETI